jgi:hypothetical protein
MPHRLACVAILLFWAVAAVSLFTRDLLPTLMVGAPPDLRSIARADEPERPTRWTILAADDPRTAEVRHAVGQVVTETVRERDGYVRMSSEAWFDAGRMLRGTNLESVQAEERVGVSGSCLIDGSGNLDRFRASVRLGDKLGPEILTLEGKLKKDKLEVNVHGPPPLGFLMRRQSFTYQPRSLVQTSLGPLDRMPGLQVGQRWRSQVVSPLTGQVQQCEVAVTRREHITWDNNPVQTLVVETSMGLMKARTWVRPDGLVLRQEVPFPLGKLILERQADGDNGPGRLR